MNNANLKCMFSVLLVLLGFLLAFFPLYLTNVSIEFYNGIVLIGFCCMLVGICIYSIQIKNVKRIQYLQKQSTPVLGHWTCLPTAYPVLEKTIKEQRGNSLYNVLLFAILAFVLNIGIYLSDVAYHFILSSTFSLLIILLTLISVLLIKKYYNQKLSIPVEVIIGEDSFYFLGNVYTFSRSIYCLETVAIVYDPTPVLVFSYGATEANRPNAYVVSIPIPKTELDTALVIKSHYQSIIGTYTTVRKEN